MDLGCALNDPAKIKDVIRELFSRFDNRQIRGDAGPVERETAVIMHELERSGNASLPEDLRLSFRVAFDKEAVPFLLEGDAKRLLIHLTFEADAGLVVIGVDGPYLVVAILPEPERVQETKAVSFGMRLYDVYAQIREITVHERY